MMRKRQHVASRTSARSSRMRLKPRMAIGAEMKGKERKGEKAKDLVRQNTAKKASFLDNTEVQQTDKCFFLPDYHHHHHNC